MNPVATGMKGDATHETEDHNCAVCVNCVLRHDRNEGTRAHPELAARSARARGYGIFRTSQVAASIRRRRGWLSQRLRRAPAHRLEFRDAECAPSAAEEFGRALRESGATAVQASQPGVGGDAR